MFIVKYIYNTVKTATGSDSVAGSWGTSLSTHQYNKVPQLHATQSDPLDKPNANDCLI